MKTYSLCQVVRCVLFAAFCPSLSGPALMSGAAAETPGRTATVATNPITVAVMNFDSDPNLGPTFGHDLAILLTAQMSAEPRIVTVERAELDKILGEQALGGGGIVSADSAARIGQLAGAKVLVTGRAFIAGEQLLVAAKVIGVETGRVYGDLARVPVAAGLAKAGDLLAPKIINAIVSRADTLVAPPVTHVDRVATLKGALPKEWRPLVLVHVPERHLGGASFDPAAQTEMEHLLTECGFTVLAENSSKLPDLDLTGEAFTETAFRRGALTACRARVELKIVQRSTGRILTSDRQTSIQVDVTEQVAAKSALADAAGTLLLRALPKAAR